MDKRRLPLFIFGSLIGLVVLTVCAAPPPRGAVPKSLAQPTITSVSDGPAATALPPIPVNDTLVKRVRALQTVPIFGGPSKQYVTVGVVAKDATVAVTGISTDGKWWRVPCDVRSQIRNQVDCWVEADPLITGPVDEPAPQALAAAPAATETAAPAPVPTATEAAPVATNTAVPAAPTATEAAPLPTATEPPPAATSTTAPTSVPPTATKPAPVAKATKPAPAPTATKAAPVVKAAVPTATKVPPTATTAPTPLPSPTAAPPTPTSQAINLKPTNVQFIITLLEVQVLDAPQSGAAIGSYPAGKKIEVTGYTSADGLWWRVICPKGNAGNCFVTADPTFTSPAVAPK